MGSAKSVAFHPHVTKRRQKTVVMGVAGGSDSSFGDGLVAAARSVIADGRRALSDPELSDPEAVHEVRKALKRWRALMRLLARPLGEQADQMRTEARELMRAIAGARDAQSALDALADLRKVDMPFSPTSIETMRARLTEMRDAADATSFTDSMRERLSRYLDYATLSLERWPLKAIDFETITNALISTYRRARQLVPDDWTDAEAEHLHDLRRRVVEHRHQMDLIEPLWPRLGKVWAEEAQRLRNRLGACQDLAVLTNLTAPHQPLAPWRSRLRPLIETRRKAHLRTAERLAGRLFAEKPKAFRRRIAALWSARNSRKAQ
ncbi:MAG TPA: CHAD domain-containing protein [Pseudolabrys sp.]|nr:CHAD domain-containing protein [Pseudolabrys sp.]